jgi:hypothetical protein
MSLLLDLAQVAVGLAFSAGLGLLVYPVPGY